MHARLITVVLSLYCNVLYAGAATNDTLEVAAAKNLFSLMNLSKPELSQINREVNAGNHVEALKSYRRLLVERLRKADLGLFGWHAYQGGRKVDADELLGNIPLKRNLAAASMDIVGPPGSGKLIKWYPDFPALDSKSTDFYAGFLNFVPLVAAYYRTGDAVYLKKWFEIADDFVLRQKAFVEAHREAIDKSKDQLCSWNMQAGSALAQGDRINNIVKSLAVVAKTMNQGGKNPFWVDILKPAVAPLDESKLDLIPLTPMADIVISLVNDHPGMMIGRYVKKGSVPNQRFCGLMGLFRIALFFSDFKTAAALLEQASIGLDAFTREMIQNDGGMIEQSFNYNLGDRQKITEATNTAQAFGYSAPWLEKMAAKGIFFDRLLDGLATPFGELPRIGNTGYNPPPKWSDAMAISRRLEKNARRAKDQPDYTSIFFPYSGYAALRNDWTPEALYLQFVNSRPSRGHGSPNCNAINISAYGRDFIVSGGSPWYSESDCPSNQLSEYRQLNRYFEESSTWKNSTVTVNGMCQARDNQLAEAAADTVRARWLTSQHFDFIEGVYDGRYVLQDAKLKTAGVQHWREVFFIKAASLWVVSDLLANSSGQTATFSQMWNFVPKNDDKKNVTCGFAESEVLVDRGKKSFHTWGAEPGPNLWFHYATPNALEIVEYFGHKDNTQYLGWFSYGIGGKRIPKVDIHVKWQGAPQKTPAPVLTVIAPSKDGNAPLTDFRDLSNHGQTISAFALTTASGIKVSASAAAVSSKLETGSIEVQGLTLLAATLPDGSIHGLALGCMSLTVEGKSFPAKNPDFEFEVAGGMLKELSPVLRPVSFSWQSSGKGIQPAYDK